MSATKKHKLAPFDNDRNTVGVANPFCDNGFIHELAVGFMTLEDIRAVVVALNLGRDDAGGCSWPYYEESDNRARNWAIANGLELEDEETFVYIRTSDPGLPMNSPQKILHQSVCLLVDSEEAACESIWDMIFSSCVDRFHIYWSSRSDTMSYDDIAKRLALRRDVITTVSFSEDGVVGGMLAAVTTIAYCEDEHGESFIVLCV